MSRNWGSQGLQQQAQARTNVSIAYPINGCSGNEQHWLLSRDTWLLLTVKLIASCGKLNPLHDLMASERRTVHISWHAKAGQTHSSRRRCERCCLVSLS
jgi:hypothetical protein